MSWSDDYGGVSVEVQALFADLEVFDRSDRSLSYRKIVEGTPERLAYKAAKQREYYARDKKAAAPSAPTDTAEPAKVAKVATCHPEAKHRSLGLCSKCYEARRNKTRFADPAARKAHIAARDAWRARAKTKAAS